MTTTTDLLTRLEDEARSRGLTKNELAGQAHLHPNTLRGFAPSRPRQRAWNPTISTLQALERVLLPSRQEGPRTTG